MTSWHFICIWLIKFNDLINTNSLIQVSNNDKITNNSSNKMTNKHGVYGNYLLAVN